MALGFRGNGRSEIYSVNSYMLGRAHTCTWHLMNVVQWLIIGTTFFLPQTVRLEGSTTVAWD